MGNRDFTFPISISFYLCKIPNATKGVEIIMQCYQFPTLPDKAEFDSKGFARKNVYGAWTCIHKPILYDLWADYIDEAKVFKRNFTRLNLQQI